MESEIHPESPGRDISPAVPLEVSVELASKVDHHLVRFANDASLDTSIVVDRSGALVSGISSESDAEIDVISVLVAGASGAMRALVRQLGESGEIESFHHADGRVVYLGEVGANFILVGVCRSGTPVGVIREKARQIKPELSELLATIPIPERPEEPLPPKKSLRDLAEERAAERIARAAQEQEIAAAAIPPAVGETESVESSPELAEFDHEEGFSEAFVHPPQTESEPPGILEFLDDGDPEIVIEPSPHFSGSALDSPFEVEVDEEPEEAAFNPPEPGGSDFPANESVFELDDENSGGAEESPELRDEEGGGENRVGTGHSVFEIDEEMDDDIHAEPGHGDLLAGETEASEASTFELDFDEEETVAPSSPPETDEEEERSEEEESGLKSQGPLYF